MLHSVTKDARGTKRRSEFSTHQGNVRHVADTGNRSTAYVAPRSRATARTSIGRATCRAQPTPVHTVTRAPRAR
eukprot:4521100-Alexandrium_andersonii.AAC.1